MIHTLAYRFIHAGCKLLIEIGGFLFLIFFYHTQQDFRGMLDIGFNRFIS